MADKTPPAPAQNDFDSAKMFVWVKALESKINNLMREVNAMKNDFILKTNNQKHDLKTLNEDVLEIKQYMEFWNPMNFVTQNDLERTIEAKLSHMTNQMNTQKNNKETKKK